ncbi:Ice-binding protein [Flavobacteriaceae bacterium]
MKKPNLLFMTIFLIVCANANAQIGIGTTTPDASAILDLSSTNKGLLMPRMTTLQQTDLASPAIGLTIFNTSNGQIETNKGDGFGGALWTGGSATTGVTAPLGTNTTQLATTEFVLANSGNYIFKEAIGDITTNLTTDILVSEMSLTPPAGTYSVSFNGQYSNAPTISSSTMSTGQCLTDLVELYNQLQGIPTNFTGHDFNFGSGETIYAGKYSVGSAIAVAGVLTLDGGGNPDAIFIFKALGAINTYSGTSIVLTNGTKACNVFWVAEGAVGIGANTIMKGVLIAHGAAVAVGAESMLEGRMFSTYGAVAFGPGVATIPIGVCPAVSLGVLSSFVLFTGGGAINNTGASTYNGDIATNAGATGSLAAAVVNGTIFPENASASVTTTVVNTTVAKATFSIYQNDVIIPNSVRSATSNGNLAIVSLQSIATVTAGQSIAIKWKTNVGALTLGNRTLTLIKVH